MRKVLHRLDALLLHPWTTRVGAVQAVVGAGVLAAGLVGGTVTLVFGFPTGWAILSAVGAFLLATSGVATLLERKRARVATTKGSGSLMIPPASPEQRELREATAWLLEDLENARVRMEDAKWSGKWWTKPGAPGHLVPVSWPEAGHVVNQLGFHGEHNILRGAMHSMGDVDARRAEALANYDVEARGAPKIRKADMQAVESAIESVYVAEQELQRIQRL